MSYLIYLDKKKFDRSSYLSTLGTSIKFKRHTPSAAPCLAMCLYSYILYFNNFVILIYWFHCTSYPILSHPISRVVLILHHPILSYPISRVVLILHHPILSYPISRVVLILHHPILSRPNTANTANTAVFSIFSIISILFYYGNWEYILFSYWIGLD